MKTQCILLVEDDAMIASGLVYALEQEGYAVTHGGSVREARRAAETGRFDLAILDMQLPDGTGFDARDALRGGDAAIIFLTVVDDEGNIVRAFEGGADDYITKPFRLLELLARVKRALNGRPGQGAPLTLGGVTIDTAAGKAYVGGELLDLTALEYRLLLTFAANKGQILPRARILEHIWDAAGSFVEDNTLTVYIKRLREKLGGAATIETVRGVGYRIVDN
ncbi:MAG: response regulator transcription factor [Oscillospiraceae bacterium]|jgi:DNA-binding response OmpR family regulator|nr:response regulator transcription factor [Oscillospiraceae bacterium]